MITTTTSLHQERVCIGNGRVVRANRAGAMRSGLTLVEVLVAAVILSVAALAALELLAATDSASLAARRQAMASIEAERALAEAAVAVHEFRSPTLRRTLDAETGGETLASCTVEIRATRETRALGADGNANAFRLPVMRLVAEVTDTNGDSIALLERLTPIPAEGASR